MPGVSHLSLSLYALVRGRVSQLVFECVCLRVEFLN